ncbi:MAG: OmpA family protein [Archangiaceae bacterium]|nr:OmpA family protein [Archangiaceae bacterium]
MKKLLLAVLMSIGCATAPKPAPEKDPAQAAAAPAPAPKPAEAERAKADVKDDVDALLKGLAIHFDFDRADLTSDSRKRLDVLAEKMRADPKLGIKVAGNADELGTEEYNLALGQKRADAVKEYLGHLGVEATRIDTVSYGEEKPLDDAHNSDAWSKNRRDDIGKK